MAIISNFVCQDDKIILDKIPQNNQLSINNIDYYAYSVSPQFKRNKGAHSYVLALYPRQDFKNIYESHPQKVIKISNKHDFFRGGEIVESDANERFRLEIQALKDCKRRHVNNIIEIDLHDYIQCVEWYKTKKGIEQKRYVYFPFYMMDYADSDLKQFLDENELDKSGKLDLCLKLAEGLKELNSLGYYHRDIKPDNILIFGGNQWKIGDLGLVSRRDLDFDKQNELIGPKGWLSPEAMNKYLAEGKGSKRIDCKIDNQSDIFQLGKVFWYILQGNAPIGCIKRSDFLEKDDSIYVLIRTMLNYSKKKRIKDISEVVKELKRIIDKTI
ncbi:MAG: protein kinase [Bacteroidaceae bacterium]|nr:protein kinase [Bacteroidaceae bacterium]